MAHLYWSLLCKACGKRHLISYIKEVPMDAVHGFTPHDPVASFRCDDCGQVHDYDSQELIFFPGPQP